MNFPELITAHNASQHDLYIIAKQLENDTLLNVHNHMIQFRELIAENFAKRSAVRLSKNDSEELRHQIIDCFIFQGCFYDIFEKHFQNDVDMLQRLQSSYNTMVDCLQKYRNI